MTDTVALEPSELPATPRVGEKVGETACIAEVSSFKYRKRVKEF